MEASPEANLYVQGLPAYVDDQMLFIMFCGYGNVVRHAVKLFPSGESKTFGFVQFDNVESAQKAIASLNGQQVGGRFLAVRVANTGPSKTSGAGAAETGDQMNLYVKNLPTQYTQGDLFDLFSPYGKIASHKIMVDDAGVCSGVGFVRYMTREEGQAAVDSLHGTRPSDLFEDCVLVEEAKRAPKAGTAPGGATGRPGGYGPRRRTPQAGLARAMPYAIAGQMIQPQLAGQLQMQQAQMQAVQQPAAVDNCNVYVHNFPEAWTKTELEKCFAAYGPISSSRVLSDKVTGKSRQIGFVRFSQQEDARTAIMGLNGTNMDGQVLTVKIAMGGPRQGAAAVPVAKVQYAPTAINYAQQAYMQQPTAAYMQQPTAAYTAAIPQASLQPGLAQPGLAYQF